MKTQNFLIFSLIVDGNFGFCFLILKQTPLMVLFDFTVMIEIEKLFSL